MFNCTKSFVPHRRFVKFYNIHSGALSSKIVIFQYLQLLETCSPGYWVWGERFVSEKRQQ